MQRAFVPPETLMHINPEPFYPEELLSEFQSMLRALADIEVQYDLERDHLDRSSKSEDEKKRLLTALQQRRRREREPYVKRLPDLQRQMLAMSELGFSCARH